MLILNKIIIFYKEILLFDFLIKKWHNHKLKID